MSKVGLYEGNQIEGKEKSREWLQFQIVWSSKLSLKRCGKDMEERRAFQEGNSKCKTGSQELADVLKEQQGLSILEWSE